MAADSCRAFPQLLPYLLWDHHSGLSYFDLCMSLTVLLWIPFLGFPFLSWWPWCLVKRSCVRPLGRAYCFFPSSSSFHFSLLLFFLLVRLLMAFPWGLEHTVTNIMWILNWFLFLLTESLSEGVIVVHPLDMMNWLWSKLWRVKNLIELEYHTGLRMNSVSNTTWVTSDKLLWASILIISQIGIITLLISQTSCEMSWYV